MSRSTASRPAPTWKDGKHRNQDGNRALPALQDNCVQPPGQRGPLLWEFPVTSCGAYHCPSEFPRHAPVGGSSSPKTSDSTACTNLVPAAVQMPLWFARPHRAHRGSLLPEAMLPTQTASLLQTAWLDSSAHPIVWLAHRSCRMTHSLRSTPITRLHRYYGMLRPCTPHRYSRFLRVLQIKLLP